MVPVDLHYAPPTTRVFATRSPVILHLLFTIYYAPYAGYADSRYWMPVPYVYIHVCSRFYFRARCVVAVSTLDYTRLRFGSQLRYRLSFSTHLLQLHVSFPTPHVYRVHLCLRSPTVYRTTFDFVRSDLHTTHHRDLRYLAHTPRLFLHLPTHRFPTHVQCSRHTLHTHTPLPVTVPALPARISLRIVGHFVRDFTLHTLPFVVYVCYLRRSSAPTTDVAVVTLLPTQRYFRFDPHLTRCYSLLFVPFDSISRCLHTRTFPLRFVVDYG